MIAMKKRKDSKMQTQQVVKTGDVVVIYGRNDFDRDVIEFTNAKDLITYIRERNYKTYEISSNEEYMSFIVSRFKEKYDGNIPCHNEEAFVAALFKLGLFGKTTLN